MAYTTESAFPIVLETRNPRSRGGQVWFLLKPLSLAGRQLSSPMLSPWLLLYVHTACKDTGHIGIRPTEMTLFSLNYLFKKTLFPNTLLLRYKGLGLQHKNLGGKQFSP